jgi:hypothetical protein
MNRLEWIVNGSHYAFVRQLELDCQLWESVVTGFLVVLDWQHGRVIPVTL